MNRSKKYCTKFCNPISDTKMLGADIMNLTVARVTPGRQ